LGDDVQIEMQNKLAGIGMQMIQRISSRGRGAPCLNIASIYMAERRMSKKLPAPEDQAVQFQKA